MQTLELTRFLKTTLAPLQQKAHAHNINLNVENDLVSFVFITADATKLSLLINRVLENTFTHAQATEIRFSTRQLLRTSNDVLLEFSMDHNGTLPPDQNKFSYYRSIVAAKELIEELNGKSEWDLNAPQGNSLKFIIRCGCSDLHEDHTGLYCQSLVNKKILVVEDNEMNQRALMRMLEHINVQLTFVADGPSAITQLESQSFDLVLMDLHMPHMDGFETTSYLRRKIDAAIPVIGMSSGEQADYTLKCFEAGMNQFIAKPFTRELLLQQMCSFFEPVYISLNRSMELSA